MARNRNRAARGLLLAALVAALCLSQAGVAPAAENPVRSARIVTPNLLRITLDRPATRLDTANFRFTEAASPDVPIEIKSVSAGPGNVVVLTAGQSLHPQQAYRIDVKEPAGGRDVAPMKWALMLTAIISAALINNFVFTRYLGLCIFFGVSKKRDTAVGMGATFTMVMITTGMMSWLLYTFVMKPLQLRFLQVLVFIGVVAFMVQLLDTILKKVNRKLHQSFGVYLVLITTNCIILAVPLLNAATDAGPLEAFALAMGAGFGFALAMFLMSCAREKMELARVPESFKGLPIAFALAGLFALAFMGFSGLNFFR
jgi:Na+-translocating ferredoxin:NAD+ oxidoreductase subunit A